MENTGEESRLPLCEEDSPLNCEYCEECFAGPSRLEIYKEHLLDKHAIEENELTLTVKPEIIDRNVAAEWVYNYFFEANDGSTHCNIENCGETIIKIGHRKLYSLKKHLYERHDMVEPRRLYKNTTLEQRWQHYQEENITQKRTYNAKCKYCSKNVSTMRDMYELKRHFDTKHKANLTNVMKKHFRKRGTDKMECKNCKKRMWLDQYKWKNMLEHIKTHCSDLYSDIIRRKTDIERHMDEFHKRMSGPCMTEEVRTNSKLSDLMWELNSMIQPEDILNLESRNPSNPNKYCTWKEVELELVKKGEEKGKGKGKGKGKEKGKAKSSSKQKEQETTRNDELRNKQEKKNFKATTADSIITARLSQLRREGTVASGRDAPSTSTSTESSIYRTDSR